MDTDIKQDQPSKLDELTAKPDDTMLTIVRHVASGGSLIDLCKIWQIMYADILGWIRFDDVRSKAYDMAVNDRSEWARESILSELRKMSTGGLSQFYDEDGNIIPPEKWTPEMDSVVESVRCKETNDGDKETSEFNIKLWNKLKAIEMYGKNLGMFAEQVNVKVLKLEDIINGSRELEDE